MRAVPAPAWRGLFRSSIIRCGVYVVHVRRAQGLARAALPESRLGRRLFMESVSEDPRAGRMSTK